MAALSNLSRPISVSPTLNAYGSSSSSPVNTFIERSRYPKPNTIVPVKPLDKSFINVLGVVFPFLTLLRPLVTVSINPIGEYLSAFSAVLNNVFVNGV